MTVIAGAARGMNGFLLSDTLITTPTQRKAGSFTPPIWRERVNVGSPLNHKGDSYFADYGQKSVVINDRLAIAFAGSRAVAYSISKALLDRFADRPVHIDEICSCVVQLKDEYKPEEWASVSFICSMFVISEDKFQPLFLFMDCGHFRTRQKDNAVIVAGSGAGEFERYFLDYEDVISLSPKVSLAEVDAQGPVMGALHALANCYADEAMTGANMQESWGGPIELILSEKTGADLPRYKKVSNVTFCVWNVYDLSMDDETCNITPPSQIYNQYYVGDTLVFETIDQPFKDGLKLEQVIQRGPDALGSAVIVPPMHGSIDRSLIVQTARGNVYRSSSGLLRFNFHLREGMRHVNVITPPNNFRIKRTENKLMMRLDRSLIPDVLRSAVHAFRVTDCTK